MKEHSVSYQDRNFTIRIGQNARENWDLIDNSDSFDLWFHVEDKPSGHVIIREQLNNKNKSNTNTNTNTKNDFFGYPHEVILLAAEYCKSQSKEKGIKTPIVYTTIDNIKKGKDVGSVIVKNSKRIVL
jgi:predicted ribosome quality control (RQC) complex YloA/Tae2 family protein